MFILGLILTILGYAILYWSGAETNRPLYMRPPIFNSQVLVAGITLLGLGLIFGGLYCLWQVEPSIVIAIAVIYGIAWVYGYLSNTFESKAERIFNIYKKTKVARPKADNKTILRKTTKTYFKSLGWDSDRVESTIKTIFDSEDSLGKMRKTRDIKGLAETILIYEKSSEDFFRRGDYKKLMKETRERNEGIEKAYNSVLDAESDNDTNNQKTSEDAEIIKLKNRVRKFGQWTEAFGYLMVIALFVAFIFFNRMVKFGLADILLGLGISIMLVVFARRLRNLKDKNNYRNIKIITAITGLLSVLSLISMSGLVVLFVFFYSLFAIRAWKKLKKKKSFKESLVKVDYKMTKAYWVLAIAIFVILLIVAAGIDIKMGAYEDSAFYHYNELVVMVR